jgi:hypothetical protein
LRLQGNKATPDIVNASKMTSDSMNKFKSHSKLC